MSKNDMNDNDDNGDNDDNDDNDGNDDIDDNDSNDDKPPGICLLSSSPGSSPSLLLHLHTQEQLQSA